jgi:hypothetical protein
MMLLPIGNDVPICAPCLEKWQAGANADGAREEIQPLRVREIPA